MKRDINLKVRLSSEEYAHLKKLADEEEGYTFKNGKKNYSGFFREHLLAQTNFKNEELRQLQKKLAYEIRKIGVNINQIAKKYNAGYGTPQDAKELKEEMEELEKLLTETVRKWEEKWESQN